MEIPRGPLAHESQNKPLPLDDFERSVLIAAGVGVSGAHFGIPYSEAEPGLSTYAARYTGRTLPSAAGIGNADMFYTEDSGTYFVSTRDAVSDGNWSHEDLSTPRRLIATVNSHTRKLSDQRVDLPRSEPNFSAHNYWNANVPGSTLFVPVANVSEQFLGFLFIALGSGYNVWDDQKGAPAGDLERFFKSGLLNRDKKYPLTYMEQYILTCSGVEMGVMGHNIALALQAVGLGGWFFSGISPFSLMGVAQAKGIEGLGFRFHKDSRWAVPNPVGLAGVYEAYCPPMYPDMESAVQAYIDLRFAQGGTYDPTTAGPFRNNAEIKRAAERPAPELVQAVVAVADYLYKQYGKFPATVLSIFVRYYTQAHRLETEFYDKYFGPGSYLQTHAANIARARAQPELDGAWLCAAQAKAF